MNNFCFPCILKKRSALLIIFPFLIALLSGCASTPKEMESLNAQPFSKCTKGANPAEDGTGIILASIETDLIFDRFYLLSENSKGQRFTMELEPRKFVLPNKKILESGRFPAKPYCYLAPTGDYQTKKIFAIFISSGPGGMGSTETVFVFDISPIMFQAIPEKMNYLGRFLFLDQRMKGKTYAERMKTFIGSCLSCNVIPDQIEIAIVNELKEDSDWGFDKYPDLKNRSIINLSENPTNQIVQSKPLP